MKNIAEILINNRLARLLVYLAAFSITAAGTYACCINVENQNELNALADTVSNAYNACTISNVENGVSSDKAPIVVYDI